MVEASEIPASDVLDPAKKPNCSDGMKGRIRHCNWDISSCSKHEIKWAIQQWVDNW